MCDSFLVSLKNSNSPSENLGSDLLAQGICFTFENLSGRHHLLADLMPNRGPSLASHFLGFLQEVFFLYQGGIANQAFLFMAFHSGLSQAAFVFCRSGCDVLVQRIDPGMGALDFFTTLMEDPPQGPEKKKIQNDYKKDEVGKLNEQRCIEINQSITSILRVCGTSNNGDRA